MSRRCREAATTLRKRYAHLFNVPIELVTVEELPDDNAVIRCPSRPELPTWTTGPMH